MDIYIYTISTFAAAVDVCLRARVGSICLWFPCFHPEMLVISWLLRAISLPPTPSSPAHIVEMRWGTQKSQGRRLHPSSVGFGVFVIDSRSSPRLRATFCLTIDICSCYHYVRTCILFFLSGLLCCCWLNSSSFFNVIHAFTSGFLVVGRRCPSLLSFVWKTCQASAEQNARYRLMLLVTRTSKTSFFFFFSIF